MPTPITTPTTHSLGPLGHLTGLAHHSPTGTHLCTSFTGLPYARPPERFRRPTPLPHPYSYGTPSHPFDCTRPCAVCPQPAFPGTRPHPDAPHHTESCLQLNVWIPPGATPANGWPVLVFLHGGWLQIGTPNALDPVALLGSRSLRAIVVAPAYRVNVFGFLGVRDGEGGVGNYGFWDQRAALEWVGRNISAFGGDKGEVVVGGYSAGAHSAFQQVGFEVMGLARERWVRRVVMWSNGCGVPPRGVGLAGEQAKSVAGMLGTDVEGLRGVSTEALSEAARKVGVHEFRATSDGAFVHQGLWEAVWSGEFGRRMARRGIQIVVGECRDERWIYGMWRPLREESYAALQRRLEADYAPRVVDVLLREHYCPGGRLPSSEVLQRPGEEGVRVRSWNEAFGAIYADLQVHALERGLFAGIERGVGARKAAELVKRYRIEWRAGVCDKNFAREIGVTHGTDMALWFWGNGMGDRVSGLEGRDAEVAKRFVSPFMRWVEEKELEEREWRTGGIRQARRLRNDGNIDTWDDEDWRRGEKVCEIIEKVQKMDERTRARL